MYVFSPTQKQWRFSRNKQILVPCIISLILSSIPLIRSESCTYVVVTNAFIRDEVDEQLNFVGFSFDEMRLPFTLNVDFLASDYNRM